MRFQRNRIFRFTKNYAIDLPVVYKGIGFYLKRCWDVVGRLIIGRKQSFAIASSNGIRKHFRLHGLPKWETLHLHVVLLIDFSDF